MRALFSGDACFGLVSSYVCFRTSHGTCCGGFLVFPQTVVKYLGGGGVVWGCVGGDAQLKMF